VFQEQRRVTPDSLTVVNRYVDAAGGKPAVYRKVQCMHCNEPCCASVCLVKAFTKTPEGPVLYNPDVCMGCRYCVMACPYYALSYEYDDPTTPRVMRCTMCYSRIKQGKNPGCADACPTGAITFGRREELIRVARERIRKHPERYIDHLFGEHEFGGTSWMVLAGVEFSKLDLHEGVTHTSLPEIGTSFLSVVPLVVTIYPGLMAGIYAFNKRKEKLAAEEQQAAVAEALERAADETKEKLDAASKRAKKDRERALKLAEKKVRAEVEKEWKAKLEQAQSGAADEKEEGK
jgi:Fe-S-cluster-containing dehydrogenase component